MQRLIASIDQIGREEWRPMLRYVAELHARSTHSDQRFPRPWEEIGPGYCYGPAFGHWDIVHQALDVLHAEPLHALDQMVNNLHHQTASGFVPGSIWLKEATVRFSQSDGHPPLWPVVIDELADHDSADHRALRAVSAEAAGADQVVPARAGRRP